MDVKSKRNIALVGHAQCGKTSLAESLLFVSGTISRKGDVAQGNTVSDFYEDEKERNVSINASYMNFVYKNHRVHLIDTPGYADFIGETISVLPVTDAAIMVVDAMNGIEVGTEDIWQRLDSFNIPRIIFVNKIEKEGANADEVISSMQEEFSRKIMRVDLDSPEFIENVAETDDQLLEKYLETGVLSSDEAAVALHKAVCECKAFPVLTGSALVNNGVKELLEAILAYLPSPIERSAFELKDPVSQEIKPLVSCEDAAFAGLIFKSMFDPHLGQLSLMRVLRGKLNANIDLLNVNNSTKEHIGTINVLQGKEQSSILQAGCGDIVALPKLKNTRTGDTLVDPREKLLFDFPIFPEPSISASIKPKTRADEEKIAASLHRLCEEDLTFKASRNNETKELIISGVGDLHLKVMLERMKRRYHVDVDLGRPKVSYRETITKNGRARHKYKKQTGGHGQYGDVELEVAPLPRDGEKFEFVNKIFGGAIPKNYIPSIEKGVRKTILEGVLAGYPIEHIHVRVVDGSYHEVDSSDMAFQIAGSLALKEAVKSAGLILLEPIMEVNVIVATEFIGAISGDISSRRGRLMGTDSKGKKDVIKAHVPLSEMFTYAADLRSMTGGRGSYTMKVSHYEQAPQKVSDKVIAERVSEQT